MKYESYQHYLDHLPETAQIPLNKLRSIILEAAPDAEETMFYNVPAFILEPIGKKIDQLIMIAAFPNHIGFYPHPTTIEHFKTDLKNFKTGKGTVQFSLVEELPKKLIMDMVEFRHKLLIDKI